MNWASVTLAAAVLIAVTYIVLGLVTMTYVVPDKKSVLHNRLPVYFVWWPYYSDMYNTDANTYKKFGQLLFPIMVGAYILAFVLK